jgi:hypothetical protein
MRILRSKADRVRYLELFEKLGGFSLPGGRNKPWANEAQ